MRPAAQLATCETHAASLCSPALLPLKALAAATPTWEDCGTTARDPVNRGEHSA